MISSDISGILAPWTENTLKNADFHFKILLKPWDFVVKYYIHKHYIYDNCKTFFGDSQFLRFLRYETIIKKKCCEEQDYFRLISSK